MSDLELERRFKELLESKIQEIKDEVSVYDTEESKEFAKERIRKIEEMGRTFFGRFSF